MEKEIGTGRSAAERSDQSVAEIKYHKSMNTRVILAAMPVYLFFIFFYAHRGSYLQCGIISALLLVTAASFLLTLRINNDKRLPLLKKIGGGIAFGLLATSIVAGLLTNDIYIAYPWIFFYPVIVVIIFSGRLGMACAAAFCAVTVWILLSLELPAWSQDHTEMFKINSVVVLIFMLIIGAISERSRLRMRNHLLEARNSFKASEARQRQTNVELKSEIDMRLESEKALSQSETRYRALFEESSVSLWEEDWFGAKAALDELSIEAGDNLEAYLRANPEEARRIFGLVRVTAANRATLELYEAESLEQLLENMWKIVPPDMQDYMIRRLVALHREHRFDGQFTAQTLTGRGLHLLVTSTIPAGYEKSWDKVFSSVYNITERVAVEEEKKRVDGQLQHTRQIQAVASLAGGIAHQFNNALAIILGNLDLLALDPDGPGDNNRFMEALRVSTERMRGLTEQLMSYARGGKYRPRDFSINELIRDVLKTSKIVRNPSIKLDTHFEEDVCLTGGDGTQIRSVLEAVLANAIEAMPGGGEVLIHTRNQNLEEELKRADNILPAGRYAIITIEDQGLGMDEEARQRIFEPFFTTKFMGRGLSMAAAYGIVRNHDGLIEVTSAPNKGTQVTIFLPGMPLPTAKPMIGSLRQAA